ncbi:SDR family NAD(P)-dependent oxidoreductase [Micromonosporaceae bacterium Da 78-11]
MISRVVVLTGASSGIGKAAALAFAARGDRLVLAARGLADLTAVAAAVGGDPLVVSADVTSTEDVEKLAEAAVERFGRIDVWVDTAAVMAYGRFEDIPAEVFDRVVTTDLLGPANVARAALRQFRLQGHGTLILCSSLLAHIATPYMSAYVAAKWGMRGLARSLRLETRDAPGIQVCTLAPGSVDTPIYTSAANYAGFVGRPPPPVDSADRVGRKIVALAGKPRPRASVGVANHVIELGFGALGPVYDELVGPMMRGFGLSQRTVAPGAGNVFEPAPRTEGGPLRWGRGKIGGLLAGAATAGAAVTVLAVRKALR